MQSAANPSLPAIWEMQGDFAKMQGGAKRRPAKNSQISQAWKGLSLLAEQGAICDLAGCAVCERGIGYPPFRAAPLSFGHGSFDFVSDQFVSGLRYPRQFHVAIHDNYCKRCLARPPAARVSV
jgi:hypothetical protein